MERCRKLMGLSLSWFALQCVWRSDMRACSEKSFALQRRSEPGRRKKEKKTDQKINRMAKYGKKAGEMVESAMHRKKKGTLKTRGGRKVKSRKQAIAIGLSEARAK